MKAVILDHGSQTLQNTGTAWEMGQRLRAALEAEQR